MKRSILLALAFSCATGQWESKPAEQPASRRELSLLRITVVGSPQLGEALQQQGFEVVPHPPFRGDLLARYEDGVTKVSSDGYFVDELRGGDPQKLAERIAKSERIAQFVRNSGTVEQRSVPGM
ncbi:MAG TPA: hypothetical protein VH083_18480 [Myxococcales bacterium]|jgi:hypothetical protein|nr:hypothetical protein [Myxococcales bacterium]